VVGVVAGIDDGTGWNNGLLDQAHPPEQPDGERLQQRRDAQAGRINDVFELPPEDLLDLVGPGDLDDLRQSDAAGLRLVRRVRVDRLDKAYRAILSDHQAQLFEPGFEGLALVEWHIERRDIDEGVIGDGNYPELLQ